MDLDKFSSLFKVSIFIEQEAFVKVSNNQELIYVGTESVYLKYIYIKCKAFHCPLQRDEGRTIGFVHQVVFDYCCKQFHQW